MRYNSELGIYVNKVEDLRDKISDEMYDTVDYLVNDNEEFVELKSNYKNLSEEFDCYEESLEEANIGLRDIDNIADELIEYVTEAKRIDRKKLLERLEEINKIVNGII